MIIYPTLGDLLQQAVAQVGLLFLQLENLGILVSLLHLHLDHPGLHDIKEGVTNLSESFLS